MNAGRSRFSIRVQDNGRGFAAGAIVTARNGGGNGLGNMRQRLRDIGGDCRSKARPPKGRLFV